MNKGKSDYNLIVNIFISIFIFIIITFIMTLIDPNIWNLSTHEQLSELDYKITNINNQYHFGMVFIKSAFIVVTILCIIVMIYHKTKIETK